MFSIKLEPIEEEVPLNGTQAVSYLTPQSTVKCEWSLKGVCACDDGKCEDCQATEEEDEKDNILKLTLAAASPLNSPDPNVSTDERMPPNDTGTCDSEEDDSDNSDTETASKIETDEPGSGKKKGSPPIEVKDSDGGHLRRSFPCGQCEKTLASRQSVRRHEATFHSTGIRPFICSAPDCGKTFVSRVDYQRHRLLHFGLRPFTCATCGAAFTKKANLKVHQRRHTEERPYVCAVCLKDFKLKQSLVRHNLTHSGLKAYTCVDCGLSFALKGTLERHRKRNYGRGISCASRYAPSERRPFSCTVAGCGRAYTSRQTLNVHLRGAHSSAKEIKCTVCGEAFTTKASLKTHRRTLHGI